MKITVYEGGEEALREKGLQCLEDEAKRLEKIFSTTDPGSELYAFDHRTEESVPVSVDVIKLFGRTEEIYRRTGGALDATAYPLVKAWGFTTGQHRIPSAEELEGLLGKVGMDKVSVSGERLVAEEGTELDFGATAKGYLSDVLTAILKDMGVTRAMLDLGGNIEVIGTKTDKDKWKIGIKDPFGDGAIIGYVSVGDAVVVTSGRYERYFTGDDGTVYWHIIDPSTGYPAHSGVVSATVVGNDATVCDALSTAFFVMGAEGAKEYRERYGAEYILVMEDGRIEVSDGLEGVFVRTDSSAVE